MQYITRREHEGLVIGDEIHVTVLQIRRDHVRLAVSGARQTPAYREVTLYCEPSEEASGLQLTASRF
jgi:carbon storage regulator CsrA